MHRRSTFLAFAALIVALGGTFLWAGDAPADKDPYAGKLARASDDWKKTVQRMQLQAGVHADLWAAEPLVANIVSFTFDEQGRCYVAETFRLHHGVTDNRGHMSWLDDDLAARTVADRVALYKKHLKKKFAEYEGVSDRVRLVEDSKGTGRADRASVFADGFSHAADGIGSGVLARNGSVWYTCIPDLWLLKDTQGTGHANVKKSLSTGYGVHVSFIGHDMHGLKMGPDGKLYFSIGDRGLHVEAGDKTIDAPDTGSVLRCNPDGSDLELVATGLRNPQELAFDEYGNLFTGDNNADGGDSARWVHLVEGGDSGWRIGYQYLPSLGAWNAEKLWHTQPSNTASYLLPPLAHIGNGPSGLTYHPGTSLLPDRFAKHFFLCDFRGSGGGSGVHSFALKPKGASFEVLDRKQFAWGVLATDCDFGPDGGFYVSDWVEGWNCPNKGRIYKLADPSRAKDADVAEVKMLLAEGFAKRPVAELVKLLGHKDMRVRQEAQFALVAMAKGDTLWKIALEGQGLARLHALWGLGQLGHKNPYLTLAGGKSLEGLTNAESEKDAEVRAQAWKVFGDLRAARPEQLAIGLKDPSPRVRFFAALAAGKGQDDKATPAVLAMLKANADADPYLRHAGVMALAGIGAKAAQQAGDDPSASVRLAGLLALRRLKSPAVARFLTDSEPKLVLEAARAIYDVPIPDALPRLAELTRPGSAARALPAGVQGPVVLRALAAHHRLGTKADAAALAEFAARPDFPEKLRIEALKLLAMWEDPPGRDRVVGLWRPIGKRPAADVVAALNSTLPGIMTGPDKVRAEGAKLAAKHGVKDVGPLLRTLVTDTERPSMVRVTTLKALEVLKDAELNNIAENLITDADPRLRNEARRILLTRTEPSAAVKVLAKLIKDNATTTIERQGALAILAGINSPLADTVIGNWLQQLMQKDVPPELELDVLQAARQRVAPPLKQMVAAYDKAQPDAKNVAAYHDVLAGGDAEAGRQVFAKAELSCVRCHKVGGVGGEVGPDLAGIGAKEKRPYLLESIVDPNKQIAKGFESVVLVLLDGQTKTGILKSEDAKVVRLMNAEGQLLTVPKDQIDERQRGPSAMPTDLAQKMSRTELRDLIEYLASLKEAPKVGGLR